METRPDSIHTTPETLIKLRAARPAFATAITMVVPAVALYG